MLDCLSGTLAHPRSSISRMYICMYVCTHVHTHVHACRLRSLPSFLCTCRGVLCSRTTTPCHTQQQNEKETPLVQSRPTTMFLLCGSIQRRLPPVIHTYIHTYTHTYIHTLANCQAVDVCLFKLSCLTPACFPGFPRPAWAPCTGCTPGRMSKQYENAEHPRNSKTLT